MIQVQVEGWDGSLWDLRTGDVRLAPGGLQGLGSLRFVDFTHETAMIDGQRLYGWRGEALTGVIRVLFMRKASQEEWQELQDRWWKLWHPAKTNRLIVINSSGRRRWLPVRWGSGTEFMTEHDPSQQRDPEYPLRVVADDPWWRGSYVENLYRPPSDKRFFGGTNAKGPMFHISRGTAGGRLSLSNDGDVSSWPSFTVRGQAESFYVEREGVQVIAADFDEYLGAPLNYGDTLEVKTSPRDQSAFITRGGVKSNYIRGMSALGFFKIEAGETIDLKLHLVGDGQLTVQYDTKHLRAWV